ncbi:type II toxin-antitoxin system VapC family toxin [Bifidobacterium felsineum]|uniref:type II toxin-antitoxin system VapC family toxin n=1 Tax=Bifidobacterium felsineum TaxID=2045440 RepID=UPI001BDBFAA9|nr:PIN domain-containing protein [Bifidobacterium felsineum]
MKSKLLLDTNVLIDYAVANRPEHAEATALVKRIVSGQDTGYTTSGSLKDFYYLCRKPLGEAASRQLIRNFLVLLDVLPVGQEECHDSAYSDEPDFEDGLIRAVAERNDMDFIITRDSGAFAHSPVKSLTARRYLDLFGQD